MKMELPIRAVMRRTLPISIFLLLSLSLEMLLSIAAVLFDIGATSPMLYAVYFLREMLLIGIPSITLVFLLSTMRERVAPLLLFVVCALYALMSLILCVIKTMFFCNFLNDVIWDSDVCVPYLLKECREPFISLLLVIACAILLYYPISKKMQAPRPLSFSPFSSRASLSYATAAFVFFLRSSIVELTGSLLPFLERINLGYATANVWDLLYIAFKFVFYFACAFLVYLLSHKLDRSMNRN